MEQKYPNLQRFETLGGLTLVILSVSNPLSEEHPISQNQRIGVTIQQFLF